LAGPWTHIAISGELGTGKTSVARHVAERRGFKALSSGDVHRMIAEGRGISTVELNHRAEVEPDIDAQIDGELVRLGEADSPTVFDSRLGWHFVPGALKVHLVADAGVAAQRLFGARANAVESYSEVEAAAEGARARQASERRRFLEKYGVDIWRLGNYDLIIDTTEAGIEEVVKVVCDVLKSGQVGQSLRVSPRRVFPTGHALAEVAQGGEYEKGSVCLGYSRPFFFVVTGHSELSRAIKQQQQLLPAELQGEGDEDLVSGISAADYLKREAKQAWVYDWEDAHDFRFAEYPPLDPWRERAATR
jgi:predicted cytidylate kinase